MPLLQRAAAQQLTPKRTPGLNDQEKQALDQALQPHDLKERVLPMSGWVRRRAKLFEVGDYPDKGVTADQNTLKTLEQNFDLPVPVLIEHAASPLRLGYLTRVEAKGNDLMGDITLSDEADRLIESSGARSLSLGLSHEMDRILEVSLVQEPRVEGARLFRSVRFHQGELIDERAELRRTVDRLIAEAQKKHAEERVEEYVRDGRLTPAQAPFAKALLQLNSDIRFSGEDLAVSTVTEGLIEARPANPLGKQLVPFAEAEMPRLDPEREAFFRRVVPDLDPAEIAKRVRPNK
jgi:hypothetical protein